MRNDERKASLAADRKIARASRMLDDVYRLLECAREDMVVAGYGADVRCGATAAMQAVIKAQSLTRKA